MEVEIPTFAIVRDLTVHQSAKFTFITNVWEHYHGGGDAAPSNVVTSAICWTMGVGPKNSCSKEEPTLISEQVSAEMIPRAKQVCTFVGMAGLMVLAKEINISTVGKNNSAYLKARWSALCQTLPQENLITEKDLEAVYEDIVLFQGWIKSRTVLRSELIRLLLKLKEPSGILAAVRDQVVLVWSGCGLRSALLMEQFINNKSRALELPAIASQAVDFLAALKALKNEHGIHFNYIKVLCLPGSETINHRLFPDLYHATMMDAQNNEMLGTQGQYIITSVETKGSKKVIDDYVLLRSRSTIGEIDAVTKANLTKLGYIIPSPPPKRVKRHARRYSSSSDEEIDSPPRPQKASTSKKTKPNTSKR